MPISTDNQLVNIESGTDRLAAIEGSTAHLSDIKDDITAVDTKQAYTNTCLVSIDTKQNTHSTSLTSIDGKLPAQIGNRLPVNLPALVVGTAVIGKVGIDQTTPGTTNAVVANGGVASDSADSGNPIKVGGKYSSSMSSLDNGDRGDLQLTNKGAVVIGTGGSAISDDTTADPTTILDLSGNSLPLGVCPLIYDSYADTWVRPRTPTVFKPFSSVNVGTAQTLWDPGSGRKFRLMGYHISTGSTGGTITFKDKVSNTSTTILVVGLNTANSNVTSPANMGNGYLSSSTSSVITAQGASGQVISGYLFGTEETASGSYNDYHH